MTQDEYRRFVERSILYRGKILHDFSMLEQLLDFYIAKHFCGEDTKKNYDLQLLLLNDEKLKFSSKAQIFHYIASRYDEQWYNNYQSKRSVLSAKRANALNEDLLYVIEQRNIFAHRVLNNDEYTSNQPSNGNVAFIRFSDEIEVVEYSEERFVELSNLINAITDYLGKKLS